MPSKESYHRYLAVTRPLGKGDDTREYIERLGWAPLIVHTVQLTARSESELAAELNRTISRGGIDWLVFMSPEGVSAFFGALKSDNGDLSRAIGNPRIVAVGPRTKNSLPYCQLLDATIPVDYSSDGIFQFLSSSPLNDRNVVLIRSSQANRTLADRLTESGAKVSTVQVYSSLVPEDNSTVLELLSSLRKGMVDGVLFTSAQSASNLFNMARPNILPTELAKLLGTCLIGAIGPVTAQRLHELGVKPELQPSRYLIDDALEQMKERLMKNGLASTPNC